MKTYLTELIEESGLAISLDAATSAKYSLCDVDPESALLDENIYEVFNSVVGKFLYVATMAHMDILHALGFLFTRVSKSKGQN
jgi:hypothetical protein